MKGFEVFTEISAVVFALAVGVLVVAAIFAMVYAWKDNCFVKDLLINLGRESELVCTCKQFKKAFITALIAGTVAFLAILGIVMYFLIMLLIYGEILVTLV